jgi:hypothetical protein
MRITATAKEHTMGPFVKAVTEAISSDSDCWEFYYYYENNDWHKNRVNTYPRHPP